MAKARKRPLGEASDIPALNPEAIAETRVFASLADFVAATTPTRLRGFGGLAEADGLTLAPATGEEQEGLLVVPRSATPAEVRSLFAAAADRPALDLCFLDYLTWLPEAEKNPLVAIINDLVNATPYARLSGYILDPEGRPRIVVSFTPPAPRP